MASNISLAAPFEKVFVINPDLPENINAIHNMIQRMEIENVVLRVALSSLRGFTERSLAHSKFSTIQQYDHNNLSTFSKIYSEDDYDAWRDVIRTQNENITININTGYTLFEVPMIESHNTL